MAFQRVPNTVEIRVIYTLNNERMMNTFHAFMAAGYVQNDLDVLAGQIDTAYVPQMLTVQASATQYVQTEVVGLDVVNDLTATAAIAAGVGGVGNFALPRSVSFVINRRSAFSGRSARGRVYIVGMPNNALATLTSTNSQITTVYADAYKFTVDAARQVIENIGLWDAVIVSRYANGTKRAEGVTFKWLTTDYRSLLVSTIRSRVDK